MQIKPIFRIGLLTGIALIVIVAGVIQPARRAQAQSGNSWNLIWSDEFNGTVGSAPDSSKWNHDTGGGGWGNNEREDYTASTNNAFITSDSGAQDGKALVIRAIKGADGNTCWYGPCQYTSARLLTSGIFTFKYGKFEARAKMPIGQGMWPAFWALGDNVNDPTVGWPKSGEIDNMETIGSDITNNHGSIHGPGYSGGSDRTAIYTLPGGAKYSDAYHVFTVEWYPTEIDWFVDGTLYETRTPADVTPNTWVFDHPFFLIANLAVGGAWPGDPDSTTVFPQDLRIDYVRVYQQSSNDGTAYTTGTSPWAVPGTIQAENYNNGGETIAYHDSDTANTGTAFRTNEGVDTEATTDTGAGYDVGWTAAGEWTKYSVNVSATGTYNLDFRVASAQTGASFHLEVDGVNVTGSLAVPNTGGWQTWSDVIKNGISLSAGQHVLRWVTDAGGANYNWMKLTLVNNDGTPYTGTPVSLPGKVELENYNVGGEGVAYHDSDAVNNGGQYRPSDGVDIEASSDTGAGYDVGWTAAGEWTKYTANVTTTGAYNIDFRVASPNAGSTFHLEVDGVNVTGTMTVPNTGGWQTWTTITKTGVNLTSGQHVLRLVTDAGGMNYNWMNISGGITVTPTTPPTFVPPTTAVTPVPTTGGGTVVVAINAGGSATTGGYLADTDFDSGNVYTDTSTTIDTSGDGFPASQAVYQNVRWNPSFTYTIPGLVPGGTYNVRLHWAELTWTAAGQRKFNVTVNGVSMLTAFDVFAAAGGYKKAVMRLMTVSASSSGQIVIAFAQAGADNPFISGIEITSNSGVTPIPPTATPLPSPTPSTNGSPYSGTPYGLPGKVEAENYNLGGEGIAYHDNEATNQGGQYRTGDGVDIEASADAGGGYDVGWTVAGEWMKYTVSVATSSLYTFDFRVASAQTGGSFHMEVDGVNVTGALTVPNTGGWQTWTDVIKTSVNLSAGQHVLRWVADAAGGNYNWFNVYAGNPTATPTQTAGSWPSRYYAPYMEMASESDLTNVANITGVKFFTLAFIIDNGSSCNAIWEGTSNTMSSSFLVNELSNLRAIGGDVIVSFGGAAGNELALDCGSVSALQAQYQSVINKYNVTHLDFDVEGGALSNTGANDLRNKALKNLEAANPNLVISYTLPVDTNGLPSNAISLLNNAVSNGTRVDVVNIMTMDYANDSRDMGSAATQAATSTESQLAGIFTGKTSAQLWHMIGITPMIGANDTQPETFTLSNASTVLSFSQNNNTRLIAMWAVSRDHQCPNGTAQPANNCSGVAQSDYQFSTTWKPFTQ